MKLAVHIFRKDLRHFYPEILLNIVLLATFAASVPYTWTTGAVPQNLLAGLLRLLLPVCWFVLVSRLLHDESLVGDRQFWITRPYRWRALLGAKLAFLLLSINVPVFCMQIYLLHHAGFAIAPAMKDLLTYQLVFSVLYIVPFVAIGVVTASMASHLFSLLGALVYVIAVSVLSNTIKSDSMFAPYSGSLVIALSIITLVAIPIGMYATRRVGAARIVLIALPLAMMLIAVVLPTRYIIDRIYHPDSRVSFSFDNNPAKQQTGSGKPRRFGDDVVLMIPVHLSAGSSQDEFLAKGVQVALRDRDGNDWKTKYRGDGERFSPEGTGFFSILLPQRSYDRLRGKPVDMELRAVANRWTWDAKQSANVSGDGRFNVPDNGHCATNDDQSGGSCRFALRHPGGIDLSAQVQNAPCDPSAQRSSFHWKFFGEDSLSLDFDPVVISKFDLAYAAPEINNGNRSAQPRFLCAGTPVTFASGHWSGKVRVSLEQKALPLDAYVTRSRPNAPVSIAPKS